MGPTPGAGPICHCAFPPEPDLYPRVSVAQRPASFAFRFNFPRLLPSLLSFGALAIALLHGILRHALTQINLGLHSVLLGRFPKRVGAVSRVQSWGPKLPGDFFGPSLWLLCSGAVVDVGCCILHVSSSSRRVSCSWPVTRYTEGQIASSTYRSTLRGLSVKVAPPSASFALGRRSPTDPYRAPRQPVSRTPRAPTRFEGL